MSNKREQYAVISVDVLDAIQAAEGRKLIEKQRMFGVYVLLSMTCEKFTVNNERLIVTRWGAQACSKRLGIGQDTARRAINDLKNLSVASDELRTYSAIDKVGKFGIYDLHALWRENGIFIPNILRQEKGDNPSAITRMFAGPEKYRVKACRLSMLLRIYHLYKPEMMCALEFLSLRVEERDGTSLGEEDAIRIGHAPTTIPAKGVLEAWNFSDDEAKKAIEVEQSLTWLAEEGLISMVRIALTEESYYVASFQSNYWREKAGDFQTNIREELNESEVDEYKIAWHESRLEDPDALTIPIIYFGTHLMVSIMPQYLVTTDKLKRDFEIDRQRRTDILDEL